LDPGGAGGNGRQRPFTEYSPSVQTRGIKSHRAIIPWVGAEASSVSALVVVVSTLRPETCKIMKKIAKIHKNFMFKLNYFLFGLSSLRSQLRLNKKLSKHSNQFCFDQKT
jgi:hypothetical protein